MSRASRCSRDSVGARLACTSATALWTASGRTYSSSRNSSINRTEPLVPGYPSVVAGEDAGGTHEERAGGRGRGRGPGSAGRARGVRVDGDREWRQYGQGRG